MQIGMRLHSFHPSLLTTLVLTIILREPSGILNEQVSIKLTALLSEIGAHTFVKSIMTAIKERERARGLSVMVKVQALLRLHILLCTSTADQDYHLWPNKMTSRDINYDRSLEWPGVFEPKNCTLSRSTFTPTDIHIPNLRLLVSRSQILPKHFNLAVVDGYTTLHIGRDAGTDESTPRIRLREMEVSKHHATIFWDKQRKEWAVVDMGSKHGSFLARHEQSDAGSRLSAPRISSIPRVLRHLDRLTIGSTTLVAHIHTDMILCDCCTAASDARNEIDLFSVPRIALKRSRDMASLGDNERMRDPKLALKLLKKDLLNKKRGETEVDLSQDVYADRSAQRRARFPSTALDAPGAVNKAQKPAYAPVKPKFLQRIAQSPKSDLEQHALESAPAIPLTSSNMGHRLLTKQGWEPGTSLGHTPGRVEPIQVNMHVKRAGLGMQGSSTS